MGLDSEESTKDYFKYYGVAYKCNNCNAAIAFRFNKGEKALLDDAGVCPRCGVINNTKQNYYLDKNPQDVRYLPAGIYMKTK